MLLRASFSLGPWCSARLHDLDLTTQIRARPKRKAGAGLPCARALADDGKLQGQLIGSS